MSSQQAAPNQPQGPASDQWIASSCNLCYNCCSIMVRVVDGTMVKIEGNPDSAIGEGRLCPKGVSGLMTHYDPYRINTPLKRTNPRKGRGEDPGFVPISWDEALDIVAEKLRQVRAEDPRKLVFQGTTTCNSVLRTPFCFTAAFGSPNWYVAGGGLHCGNAVHTLNGMYHASWSSVPDFEFCNYALYFGCSKGHSAGHVANANARLAAEARERGMRMVVVDPIQGFAASKAVEWVPILPGTDAALALAMVNVMLNELGRWDEEYLKLKTNGPYLVGPDGRYRRDPETGKPLVWDPSAQRARPFDDSSSKDFALTGAYEVGGQRARPAFALLKEHVATYTPEYSAGVTSVPAATIRRLATEFSAAARIGSTIQLEGRSLTYRPAAAAYFRGPQGHKNGLYNCFAIELLNQVCGTADRVGGALGFNPVCHGHPETGRPQYAPTADDDGMMITGAWVVRHKPYPVRKPAENIETMGLYEIFPMAAQSPLQASKDQQEVWDKVGLPYRPEVMLNFGANSVMSLGNADTVIEALCRIPFIASFDLFQHETTDLADIVLPDTSYLERFDAGPNAPFIFNHPAGRGMWSWAIRQPVVPPAGERRDIQEIMIELADRLGMVGDLNRFLNLIFEIQGEYRLDPDTRYTWEEVCDRRLKSMFGPERGLDWFKEQGVLNWPKKIEEVYWRDFINVRVPVYMEFLVDLAAGARPVAERYGISVNWDAYYHPLPAHVPDELHAENSEFDLYGFYYRDVLHTNSFTMENPVLDELSRLTPGTYDVSMNTRTARERGIRDGDTVVLESSYGRKVRGTVRLREGIHPRCVAVAGNCGHWSDGQPIAKGKGVFFNDLLEVGLDHVNPVTLAMELSVRLKVYKG